jgi:four helix bundle protein
MSTNADRRSSKGECQNTEQRRRSTRTDEHLNREVDWKQGRFKRRGDDIAQRLRRLATGVLRVTAELPDNANGKHIGRQLLRAGTSPGANYEEARGAESRSDFIHKLAIAIKEVRESQYWLQVIRDAELHSSHHLDETIDRADELISILTASRKTAITSPD